VFYYIFCVLHFSNLHFIKHEIGLTPAESHLPPTLTRRYEIISLVGGVVTSRFPLRRYEIGVSLEVAKIIPADPYNPGSRRVSKTVTLTSLKQKEVKRTDFIPKHEQKHLLVGVGTIEVQPRLEESQGDGRFILFNIESTHIAVPYDKNNTKNKREEENKEKKEEEGTKMVEEDSVVENEVKENDTKKDVVLSSAFVPSLSFIMGLERRPTTCIQFSFNFS